MSLVCVLCSKDISIFVGGEDIEGEILLPGEKCGAYNAITNASVGLHLKILAYFYKL